jgi:hypothetical protein
MKRLVLFLSLIFTCGTGLFAQILLPNIPDVTGGLITAFEFDSTTNKLYIIGEFTQVGSTPRTGFAVIDITTGAVLNDFDPLNITNSSINSTLPVHAVMHMYKNKLYIGGVYNALAGGGAYPANYIFALDLSNGSIINLYTNGGVSDFKIYNDKIYVSGGYENYNPDEYMISELDTMGNILWQKSISNNPGDELHCIEVKNNFLFAGGNFSAFDGIAHNNIVEVDLSTHLATPWSLSPQPGPVATPTCFGVSNLVAYNNDILVDLYNPSCASPHNIGFYDIPSGSFINQKTTLPYLGDFPNVISENDTSFWFFNGTALKLYGVNNYIFPWSPNAGGSYAVPFFRKSNYLFVGGNFTTLEGASHSGLGIYCLSPDKPIVQTASSTVCRQQNNISYSVIPNPWAESYVWTYTGTGATINGSGSTVNLDFSSNATSGSLNVFAISTCGTTGPALSIPITVNPLPATNAGADINFTCTHTNDSLKATPNNFSVHCVWTGPSSFFSTSFNNQVLNSNVAGGNYILTVIINATGCQKTDTAKIIFDTLIPTINHLAGNYYLTCATTSLTLDAAGNYPLNDTLRWSGSSFSQNNPATINNAGTYVLSVTSGVNGCKNKDSIVVTQNTAVPNLSLPITQDTITCIKDSIQLHSVSSNSAVILYWKHTATDSLLNNSYVNQYGIYTAHAIDTSNRCSSQTIFTVSQFTTSPIVNITPGNYQINCSYDTVILSGNSPNAGATLNWTGPGSFSSPNPATIILQGTYVITAMNPQNGCTVIDSVTVLKQNTLSLNISPNTTICNGSSTTLSVSSIGGTPGFTYIWNNNAGNYSHVSVNPTDTTIYVATLTDSTGCVGKDSVKVNVPIIFSDSIATFVPCDPNHPNGQIQAFTKGGVQPYTYSLNYGMFQPQNIFSNLVFGTYTISIRDGLGCPLKSFATIDSTSLRPSADFILSTNEIKGDTFVLVDISNPRPDSVSWILPMRSQLLNSNSYAPEIISSDTGALQITMLAWFGNCQMSLTKNIHVFKNDTLHATEYNANGIKDITIYPNPNTGNFIIDVSLYKIQTFAIFIFDATGNELLRLTYPQTDFISAPVNITNPTAGIYVLKIISEYDSKTKTIQISN